MKFLSHKRIQLGAFLARQFTLIEIKRLFSIVAFWFKGDGWQDRFHDHAFVALSLRIWGTYRERVLCDGKVTENDRAESRWRFIPRNHMHMLGVSRGCLVLVFTGPWLDYWHEVKDGQLRKLGWGRRSA